MIVRYAHLCDYTLIANNGKPSLIGIFNRVWTHGLPFNLSQPVTAFVCFIVENEDPGTTVHFEAEMLDPEHRSLLRVDFEIEVGPAQEPGNFYFNWLLKSMRFLEQGPHVFQIRRGSAEDGTHGETLYEIDFFVEYREPKPDG